MTILTRSCRASPTAAMILRCNRNILLGIVNALSSVCFALNVEELQSPLQNFIKLNSFFLVLICFLSTWVLETLWENVNQLLHCYAYRKCLQTKLYSIVYFLLISRYMELLYFGKSFPLCGLLLLAGDIESNPGPQYDGCLKFFIGI